MNDKVFLITGASSGMGRDAAYYLAERGVKGLTTLTVGADVTSDADNKRAVEETVAKFGGIHGAFVNAGVYRGGATLAGVSDADIDAVIDT
jgi:NAD(P)-dependent dehydrogenase (short-subunit alcohol dehydrogenase family)